MKKSWFLIAAVILALVLIGLVVKNFILGKERPGALQVSSTPKATVFVDEIQVGLTPYFDDKIKAGEHTIKLVPEATSDNLVTWEGKVVVASNVMTVINRVLGTTDSNSSGEVLSLEKISSRKNSSLAVVSIPDGATVKINGESKGFSPVLVEDQPAGDYEVTVVSGGFEEKTISANTVAGYKLTVHIQLAQKIEGFAEATPSGEKEEETKTTPTPSPKTTITPTPKPKTTPVVMSTPPPKPYVTVKETPTGWLRVRKEPSTSAEELAKINPGEMYPYLGEEKNGWLKIEYEEDKEGWASKVYLELVE